MDSDRTHSVSTCPSSMTRAVRASQASADKQGRYLRRLGKTVKKNYEKTRHN